MSHRWPWLPAVLLVLLLTGAAPPPLAPGAVVGLAGTPHLWIADAAGVLHWGGDTRALASKHVNWRDRRDVSLTELQTYPIGDPWLSAGLLKDGDPIYQVKWETDWPQPKLLHIQSIKDVELFGIDGSNYGHYVMDKPAWEQRYGIDAAPLERQPLASAVPPGVTLTLIRVAGDTVPALSPAWPNVPTIPLNTVHRVQDDDETWEVTVLEVVRGQPLADFAAQHPLLGKAYQQQGLPADQEDLAVKVRVKYLGSSALGGGSGILGRYVRAGCFGGHCTTGGFVEPFEVIMENGEEGVSSHIVELAAGRGDLKPTKPMSPGTEQVGWRVWRVWKDMPAVFVLETEFVYREDDADLRGYLGVFALS